MRVLMLPFRGPRDDNPYVSLLNAALSAERTVVIPFSWRRLMFTRYDVLHVHWPELLFRDKRSIHRVAKIVLFGVARLRNRFLGIAHVQTMHNLRPHEPNPGLEHIALKLWWATLDGVILMNHGARPTSLPLAVAYIPHGTFLPVVQSADSPNGVSHARREADLTHILHFGHMRRYKNLERLIIAASELEDVQFTAVGRPADSAYAMELLSLTGGNPRIQILPEAVTEALLLRLISDSDVVCLPYENIYNSGAAILSLSARRPVVATNSASMRELALEVGEEWLHLIPNEWTAADLRDACAALRSRAMQRESSAKSPLAPERDWVRVGAAHRNFYDAAAASARSGRPTNPSRLVAALAGRRFSTGSVQPRSSKSASRS